MFVPSMLVFLAAVTTAAARNCIEITVPVELRPRNVFYQVQTPKTEVDLISFVLDFGRRKPLLPQTLAKKSKVYNLATTYCWPDSGPGHSLQILTHGIGFDRSYWDFAHDNGRYSYVDRALARGYSTLSWDRLGIGASSHGDPINEIQLFLQMDALLALTSWVRSGGLPDHHHRHSRMVHVGHSYGSALTTVLTNQHPSMTDCIILTGFSQVYKFLASFILAANLVSVKKIPSLAGLYDEGYVAPHTSIGVQTDFFAPHNFDPAVLQLATERRQPAALGELMTLSYVTSKSSYRGPVLLITGDRDIPFCGGNCSNTPFVGINSANMLENSRPNFASSSIFETVVVEKTGHGLNLEYTAPTTFKMMLDFADKHLPPSEAAGPSYRKKS
ncbi:hypothetical protein L249_6526 [Ophiocordyceps polyrhachis-furcata BCC 54312]|uniref:AB hydrolase-1 domain-containing protein n=1 Tax=Ophiocordyceps polyrhachis-furcata BCC 54312 TaxID=1330021 RepID=A0A367LLP2_9HYPO|nr:hypothetical protein L249_6526 [Ophiocordyceps polyrhachis-furcata BCC 54312]